ncbi:hypothetical protein [Sphingomonas donggukensis]|nr:hypothetical protein [Sphingomonas donggukensis]
MNAWPFVLAAWGLTLVASIAVAFVSWMAMRRAEGAADRLKRP